MHIYSPEQAEMPIITELARKIWPFAYHDILTKVQMEYMLRLMYEPEVLSQRQQDGHLFYILREGNKNIGFAELGLNHVEIFSKLHKLYVLPAYQGKGLGQLLLNKMISVASENHQQGIILNVNRANKAKTFYEMNDFEVIRSEDVNIGNGFFMNDYVMRRFIAPL